jgi:hypothetical protein
VRYSLIVRYHIKHQKYDMLMIAHVHIMAQMTNFEKMWALSRCGNFLHHFSKINDSMMHSKIQDSRAKALSSKFTFHKCYLHIGPSGDVWIGQEMFAAKHLQPGYVKSIVLPSAFNDQEDSSFSERLIEKIECNSDLAQKIYDEEQIPMSLLEAVQKSSNDQKDA